MSKSIASYVNPDQMGFIPGRHLKDNVRKVSNIIVKAQTRSSPVALIFLDAEKAFDCIEWNGSTFIW